MREVSPSPVLPLAPPSRHLAKKKAARTNLRKQGFPALQYAAELNFNCNVINDQLRGPDDQPTIGIIQCQSRNNILAQDAFTGVDKPIGVSSYDLSRSSPNDFKSALPTVEQIEAEIASPGKRGVKRQKSPRK